MEITLRDLLGNPKARGLAGNMLEPLFTKKMQTPNEKRTLIVVGCELPTDKKSSPKLLVSEKTSTISHFDFKDSKELMTKVANIKDSNMKGCYMGKAEHDNYPGIDGVLVHLDKKGDVLSLYGLQMTVTESSHGVLESCALDLQNICSKYNNFRAEIWFLQPDDCLESDTFGFVCRQTSKFSPAKIKTASRNFSPATTPHFLSQSPILRAPQFHIS
jgi:hypothetical protein